MKRLIAILMLMLSMVSGFAAGSQRLPYFRQRLHSNGATSREKVAVLDSLIVLCPQERDSLLLLKSLYAYDAGSYADCVKAVEGLDSKWIEALPVSQRCRMLLNYTRSLDRVKDYRKCLAMARELLQIYKPDSLAYYDAHAISLLHSFIRRTNNSDNRHYVDKVRDLLNTAIRNKSPKHTIDRIRYSYLSMKMTDALHSDTVENALIYADSIMSLPLSEIETVATECNIAYVYMMIGKYDEAEKLFRKLIANPLNHYNQGVVLLNYTHLLNQQGRYSETIEVLESHPQLAAALNNDLYYSYLLGNQSIAEAFGGDYEKGYHTLMHSKELGDSLNYNSGIQDGFLLLAHDDDLERIENLERSRARDHAAIWTLSGIVLALGILGLWLGFAIKRKKRLLSENEESLSTLRDKCKGLEMQQAETHAKEEGHMSVQLLRLAEKEEMLERISEIVAGKTKSDEEKIKKLKAIVSSIEKGDDSRELFERQFEQAHSQFFKRLYADYPDLTPVETRLCAYVIMNLSTKEIASVTSKSVRSIESVRYRVGKKLALPEGTTLLSYLRRYL